MLYSPYLITRDFPHNEINIHKFMFSNLLCMSYCMYCISRYNIQSLIPESGGYIRYLLEGLMAGFQ